MLTTKADTTGVTMTRERPILFSSAMVRAILAGAKTQTRRIVRWRGVEPGLNLGFSGLEAAHYFTGDETRGWVLYSRGASTWQVKCKPTFCPYGLPGNTTLWIRETWQHAFRPVPSSPSEREPCVVYAADGEPLPPCCKAAGEGWRPSIFMPRWASRLTLVVEAVRVERVQAITEADAAAEGIIDIARSVTQHGRLDGYGVPGTPPERAETTRRNAFATLWDTINGKRAPWASNPFVFVVTFRRIEPVAGGAR